MQPLRVKFLHIPAELMWFFLKIGFTQLCLFKDKITALSSWTTEGTEQRLIALLRFLYTVYRQTGVKEHFSSLLLLIRSPIC